MLKKIFTWIFRNELQAVDTITKKLEQQSIKTEALYDALKKEYIKAHNTRIEVEKDLNRLNTVFGNVEVSLDHHGYRDESWAVISIAGGQSDYIKFVDMRERDIRELQKFLQHFDRSKIDHAPQFTPYFYEVKRDQKLKRGRNEK